MEQTEHILDTPVEAEQNFEYAGFWIRVGAYLIDGVILWIVNLIIELLATGDFSFTDSNVPLALLSVVIGVLYFCSMESSARQATLGKMAVGIKVGNFRGEQISFGNALGRYFAKILSGIIFGIGFMMIGWDAKKQGLHDRLADTYVYYS